MDAAKYRCRCWTGDIEVAENEDNVIYLDSRRPKTKRELVGDWKSLRSEVQGARVFSALAARAWRRLQAAFGGRR